MATDELLDLLDEYGNLTGRTTTRTEVYTKGLWHRSVHVWIVNSRGEILIQKRSNTKDDHPGEWDTVHGGHLQTGQTAVEGAIRELKEELNLDVAKDQLELLFEHPTQSQRPGYIKHHWHPVFLLLLDRPVASFTFADGEVDELRWVSLIELERMVANRTILAHDDEEQRVIAILHKRFGGK